MIQTSHMILSYSIHLFLLSFLFGDASHPWGLYAKAQFQDKHSNSFNAGEMGLICLLEQLDEGGDLNKHFDQKSCKVNDIKTETKTKYKT